MNSRLPFNDGKHGSQREDDLGSLGGCRVAGLKLRLRVERQQEFVRKHRSPDGGFHKLYDRPVVVVNARVYMNRIKANWEDGGNSLTRERTLTRIQVGDVKQVSSYSHTSERMNGSGGYGGDKVMHGRMSKQMLEGTGVHSKGNMSSSINGKCFRNRRRLPQVSGDRT